MNDTSPSLSRRDFIVLAAGAAAGSCNLFNTAMAAEISQIIDVGPAASFMKEGVYDAFSSVGFFIIRRDGNLFALSSICTH